MINRIIFFILILLLIILLVFLNFRNFLDGIKNIVFKILGTFVHFFKKIIEAFVNFIKLIFQIRIIQEENNKLKNENLILISKLINDENLLDNYKDLERQFGLRSGYRFKLVPANVLGADFQETGEFLIINKGKNDGLEPDMPVVIDNVLIGKIFQIHTDYSSVILINDDSIKVAAKTQNFNASGVTKSENGQIFIDLISKDKKLEEGDVVFTSGRDGVFPANLILGKVEKIYDIDSQLFQKVKIDPLINYYQQENVFVITNYLK